MVIPGTASSASRSVVPIRASTPGTPAVPTQVTTCTTSVTQAGSGTGVPPNIPPQNQLLHALLLQSHREIRRDLQHGIPANFRTASGLTVDRGAALATIGTVMNEAALVAVRQGIRSGMFFAIQLVGFVHQDVPKICYCIWMPHTTGCFRCIIRVEDLSDLYARAPAAIEEGTEENVITAAVEELLLEEQATPQKVLSVSCRMSPNSWSFYETESRAHVLELTCLVPTTLTNAGLTTWQPPRMGVVFKFLERLSVLCSSETYLGRVLSAFGVVFGNLPSRQSFLFWAFVGRALEVVLRDHQQLARLLANGCPDDDRHRLELVGQLEDAGFLAECRLLATFAVPLGRAVSEVAKAGTLSEFLVPILDFVNWMIGELTTRGNNVLHSLCWEILFEGPQEVRELDDRRLRLPLLRQVPLHHLNVEVGDLHQEMQDALQTLYDNWCLKWETLLSSSLARIVTLPFLRVGPVLQRATEL